MNPAVKDALLAGLAFLIAWGVSLWSTPRLREAAIRFGIVDRPDGKLKTQQEPVAYLGGLAVAFGMLVAVGVTYSFSAEILGILFAGWIVLVLGLLDDLGSLSPKVKLAGQLLAVLVMIKADVRIHLVFLPEWVAIPLTVLWMLSVINAFNLIDIMDGLSSGVGIVAAVYFGGIALIGGLSSTGFLGLALAGALLGFRRYNTAPAKIYLGDTGSMFCGFMLGALAMVNRYTIEHRLAAVVPLLILGVPFFDMLFVMYVRWRRGHPVMLGSPDHIALRLRKWRLSTEATVHLNVIVSSILGACGVAVMLVPLEWAAGLIGVLALLILVTAAWLKTIDMSL